MISSGSFFLSMLNKLWIYREDMMAETDTQLTQVFKKADGTAELIARGEDITVTLTDSEKVRFKECESVIKKGLGTFLEVGRALADIHDNRLYRETHKSFKKYCKDVWDLGESTAYQKIDGYQVVKLLESKTSAIAEVFKTETGKDLDIEKITLPVNEAQARKLTRLKKNPDDQVKAWTMVLGQLEENPKTKPTAALIGKTVKEVRGEVAKRKIDKTKKAVDATSLLSRQFKVQYQVMMDIIDAEKNNEWVTSKRKEVIKWLSTLVKIAESDD